MTTIDRVATRTTPVDWQRVALTALMALPFVLAFTVRTVARAIGWSLSWMWAAAVVGWESAGPSKGMAGP